MSGDPYFHFDVIDTVFEDIAKSLEGKDEKDLSKQQLFELESLFGRTIVGKALIILDNKQPPGISVYKQKIGNCRIVQIPCSNGNVHTIHPNIYFCNCSSFKACSIEKKDKAICEHILAGKLAVILHKYTETLMTNRDLYLKKEEILEEYFVSYLTSSASSSNKK